MHQKECINVKFFQILKSHKDLLKSYFLHGYFL